MYSRCLLLKSKYGDVTSSSPQRSFEIIDNTANAEAYLAFDNNTVVFKIVSDENLEQTAMVMYTSPEYDDLLKENQKKNIGNDL